MTKLDLSAFDNSKFLNSQFIKAAAKPDENMQTWLVAGPLILMNVALAAFLRPVDEDAEYDNQVRGILSELVVYDMLPPDYTVCIDESEPDWSAVSPETVLGLIVENWRAPEFYVDNLIALFSAFRSYMLYVTEKVVHPHMSLIDQDRDTMSEDTRFLLTVATQLKLQAQHLPIFEAQITAIRGGGSGAKN